jgi:hypothetical protein
LQVLEHSSLAFSRKKETAQAGINLNEHRLSDAQCAKIFQIQNNNKVHVLKASGCWPLVQPPSETFSQSLT